MNAQEQVQGRTSKDLPAIAGGNKAKATPYGAEQHYGTEELDELRKVLDQQYHGRSVRFCNVDLRAMTNSAGSGHNALATDPEYAANFLNEFQDRLLFGTDICAPGTPTPLVGFLLAFREQGKMSEEAFQKIARENAINLLGLRGVIRNSIVSGDQI